MKADKGIEAEVRATLEEMAKMYSKKDVEAVMRFYAPDPDLVVFGTGKDELARGLDQLREGYERDFEQAESIAMSFDWLSVSAVGDIAWFASEISWEAQVSGEAITLPGRFTGVMEKRGGNWIILQAHFSLPSDDQAEGESFPKRSPR